MIGKMAFLFSVILVSNNALAQWESDHNPRNKQNITTAVQKAAVEPNMRIDVTEIMASADAANKRKDYAEARRWYLKAAEQGDSRAQNNLGAMYNDGLGVARDSSAAMKWYRMAATGGNVQAAKNIGDLYAVAAVPAMCKDAASGEVSLGCVWIPHPNDLNELQAVKWYRKAADGGNAGAMTNMGRMFALGQSVKQNCAVAKLWFDKAAVAGNEPAIANLRSGVGMCRW
jgi:TPR repeat protein